MSKATGNSLFGHGEGLPVWVRTEGILAKGVCNKNIDSG